MGVSGFAWMGSFEERHLELLGKVRGWGFDGFEIPMFDPAKLPVAAMRRGFEENGLECTICAILPAGVNPISPDAGVRKRSVEHVKACVETAAELGAHLLGGPLYAPIGYLPGHRPTAEEWTRGVECFQGVGEYLTQHDVTLSIEPVNRSETFFLRRAEEGRRFCEAIGHPLVGVTIDTFHAHIEEKDTVAAVGALGATLRHMHLSENDRGLLGSGQVDFPGVLGALKQIEYDGYLMIEGFGYAAEEPTAPGWLWADPAVSPEAMASDGLAYLKGLGA